MTGADFEALIAERTDGGANPISTERDLWRAVKNEVWKMFEVKEIDVNLTLFPNFLTDNFIMTPGPTYGLGINDYSGLAISNGNNGTRDRGGKTSVGFQPSGAYSEIGAGGGEERHTLAAIETPSKKIHVRTSQSDNGEVGGQLFVMANTQETAGIDIQAIVNAVSHNNMQPYIITLKVQRIA